MSSDLKHEQGICEVLNLEGKCLDLDAISLQDAEHVKKLNLSFNSGISLQQICKFRCTSQLLLHSCHLTKFPEEVTHLVNLHVLVLSYNDIAEIPQTVNKLHQLEELDLSGNRLMENFSPSIAHLQQLRILKLSSCSISALPEQTSLPTRLETLDLSDNRHLMSLPITVTRLPMLKVLNLSCCAFSRLPEEMAVLETLVVLDVSNNPLAKSTKLNLPPRLVKLVACCCQLEVPPDFTFMSNLEELNISDNAEVSKLPPVAGQGTMLRNLTVSFCNLMELPDAIDELFALESLDCSYNHNLSNLPSTLTSITRLKYLNFSKCNISALPEDIGLLESLVELDCSRNTEICKFPETIGKLSSLRKLSAACCSLSELSVNLACLKNLEHLDVRNNRLSSFPLCTLELTKLKVLILSNDEDPINANTIQSLPADIVRTSLTTLDLYGNPMVQPPSVVCQRGIDAVKAYMMDVNNEYRVPGSCINILECVSTGSREKCKLTSSMFDTGVYDTVTLNGSPVVLNDLTALADYPQVVSEFLSESGVTVITFDLSEESFESISTGGDCPLLKQDLRRWIFTILCRFSNGRTIVVGRLPIEQDDVLMVPVEKWIVSIVTDLFTSAQEDVEKFFRRFNSFECSTEPARNINSQLGASLRRRSADVHVIVLHRKMDAIRELETVVVRKFHQELVFHQLVVPEWWHAVVSEIRQCLDSGSPVFPYLTWHQVQQILYKHSKEINEDCKRASLIAILQSLSSSAQVTWMRGHAVLDQYILGPPCVLLKAVRKVLECQMMTSATDECWRVHSDALQNGLLHQRILGHILLLEDAGSAVAFHFLKAVGVICDPLNTSAESRHAGLIVSQFPEERPADAPLNFYQFMPGVTISIEFIGFTIPYGFFENCFLTTLCSLKGGIEEEPKLWCHGMSFTQNRVSVTLSLVCNVVSVSARGETDSCDIWDVLYPLLQHLAGSIRSKWKGIKPIYRLLCARCLYIGNDMQPLHNDRCGSRVLPDLDMVRLQPASSGDWTCSVCKTCIPSYLSFPRMPGCLLAGDKSALATLETIILEKQPSQRCVALHTEQGFKAVNIHSGTAETMTMSSSWPQSETSDDDIFKCVICSRDLVDPVLLACLHSACSSCTGSDVRDSLTCPSCHVTTDAPTGKTNLIVSSLAHRSLVLKGVFSCTQCSNEGNPDAAAVLWCYTCQQSLCLDCQKVQNKVHSAHTLMNLDGSTNLSELYRPPARSCKKHNKEFRFACFTCKSGSCSICVHDCFKASHDVLPLDDSDALRRMDDMVLPVTRVLYELNTSLTPLQAHLNLPEKLLSAREESLATLKKAKKTAMDSIIDAYDSSAESLLDCWDSLLVHALFLQKGAECFNRRVSWTNAYCKMALRSNDIAGLLPQLDVLVSSLEILLEETRRFHGPIDPTKLVRCNTRLPSDLNLIASGWFGQAKLLSDGLNSSVKDSAIEENIDYYKRTVSTLEKQEHNLQSQKQQLEMVQRERQDLAKQQSEFIIKYQELAAAQTEVENLVEQKKVLQDELELQRRKLEQQQSELTSISQQLVSTLKELEQLLQSRKEQQELLQNERAAVEKLQSEMILKDQELVAARKEVERLLENLKQEQNRSQVDRQLLQQLQSDVLLKDEQLVAARNEVERLLLNLQQQHDLSQLDRQLLQQLQQLQSDVLLKDEQLVSTRTELAKLLQKHDDEQDNEHEHLRLVHESMEELQKEMRSKEDELVSTQAGYEELLRNQDELKERLRLVNQTVEQLQSEIALQDQHQASTTHLSFDGKPRGTFKGPGRCWGVAVTPQGRLLVAAMADGLKEYDAASFREISTWKPDGDLLGDETTVSVRTVDSLADGRALVGLLSKLVVLLRRDAGSRTGGGNQAWRVERRVAELQAPPRRLSAWGDRLFAVLEDRYDESKTSWLAGPGLVLFSLSHNNKLLHREQLDYNAGSVALTDRVVVVSSVDKLDATVAVGSAGGSNGNYVVDCYSHVGVRLWRHEVSGGLEVTGVCWDSVGGVLYAAKRGSVIALSVDGGREVSTAIRLSAKETERAYALQLDRVTRRLLVVISYDGEKPNQIAVFPVV